MTKNQKKYFLFIFTNRNYEIYMEMKFKISEYIAEIIVISIAILVFSI